MHLSPDSLVASIKGSLESHNHNIDVKSDKSASGHLDRIMLLLAEQYDGQHRNQQSVDWSSGSFCTEEVDPVL